MALVLKDRVKETSTTTGTGTFTLNGAAAGYSSFSTIGNGNTTYYTIADQVGNNWEVGIGTYTAAGTTLSRDTVLANSAGTTAKISFTSGNKDVFCTYPAEQSVNLDASNNVSALGTVASGTWQGTTIGIAYGGTGQTTQISAFNALSPITSIGDLILGNGTNSATRLGIGTNLQVLTSNGTTASWVTPPANVSSFSAGTTGFTPNTSSTGAVTLSGTLGVANGGTGITSFGTGVATFLGTPSSANLAAAVTDETGTGALVFATSPTLVTPTLGAATGTSLAVSASALTSSNTSNLSVGGSLNFSDTGIIANSVASTNSYLQQVIQNTNAGASASAEWIAYNDSGTATTNYAAFGINSTGYTGTGSINAAGYAYFLSGSTDLVVGTIGNNALHFVVNSGATDAMTISTSGYIGMGTLSPLAKLSIVGTGYSPNINLTDATTIAWDTTLGQVATFTFVSSNRTVGAPTGLVNGGFYALAVIQNAGANTLTWNSVFKWPGAVAPTLSTAAGAKDYFVFRSDGTNLYLQGQSLAVA